MPRKPLSKQEEVSDSVNLLVSILVRYPQIASVNLDPVARRLKFSFLVSGSISPGQVTALEEDLLNRLALFHELEGGSFNPPSLAASRLEGLTMLEAWFGVAGLSQGEISLFIGTLQDKLGDQLVADRNDGVMEEDLLVQEELIDHILANVKPSSLRNKNIIAFREEGKVHVFNK
ncbi:MAG: hypothetical protein HYY09_04245 [Firmicutes bacterium]|nr:hypothetical protein [Bacillota bacterium]